jgi:DNA-binding transcriptional ArsR family regulator
MTRGAPLPQLARAAAERCYRALRMNPPKPLDESLSKALAHPLRWRILEVVNERGEASPVEVARALDQPLATISHHVRVLRESGSLVMTRTEQRRGALEHYYRVLMPAFFDDEQWSRVPIVLRRTVAGQIFTSIVEEAAAAGERGGFDAPGAHIDRMVIELDDPGWMELSDLLSSILRQAQDIQNRSDARRGSEDCVRTSEVAILHFERAESMTTSDAEREAGSVPERSPRLP